MKFYSLYEKQNITCEYKNSKRQFHGNNISIKNNQKNNFLVWMPEENAIYQ